VGDIKKNDVIDRQVSNIVTMRAPDNDADEDDNDINDEEGPDNVGQAFNCDRMRYRTVIKKTRPEVGQGTPMFLDQLHYQEP